MDERVKHSLGLCLGSFFLCQEFLEGSWVGKSEKQRFSCEEQRKRWV